MLRRLSAVFVSFAVVFSACGGPTTLEMTRYDHSCASASDCVLVTTNACCGCPNSAINGSALTQYEADLSAASKNCGSCTDKPCLAQLAVCANGVCAAGYPSDAGPPDAGGEAGSDASTDAVAPDAGDAASEAGGQDATTE